ncbi:MAG TPA: undecaprenyl-phosphate glucose phosphotransferase [Candidatus Limnocylindrales bacterium]|nr:undecaprenyl-phosphate glucose phosphotransferase [Candidatus Limnocylindrales bacterium]
MAAQPDPDGAAAEGRAEAAARDVSVGTLSAQYALAARRSDRLKALVTALLYISDISLLVLAFVLGYWARLTLPLFNKPANPPDISLYIPTLVMQVTVIVVLFYFGRMYHLPRAVSRIDTARNVLVLVSIGALLVNGLQEILFKNTIFNSVDYPRSMFFYVVAFSVVLVTIGREIMRLLQHSLRRRGIIRDNLLIVGVGKIARDLTRKIKGSPELGYEIVGIVSTQPMKRERISGVSIIGERADLPMLIDTYRVEQVIIALPDEQRSELIDLITLCQRGRVDIKVYPDMFAYIAGDMSVGELGDIPLLTVRDMRLRGWRLSLKRALDLVGSLVGLILLAPFLLLTAIIVKLTSPGPVFYTQERMGLDGRPFEMIKFRSMRQDAEAAGPGWTTQNDPRVTPIGRLMRRTNLDELPQLINVLLGEMSMVGPRPERPVYVQQFRSNIPRYMERHREKAGMTGWAQVNGLRGDTSIAERTAYDLWYVENWSLWLDIKIIIRTVVGTALRRDQNAY